MTAVTESANVRYRHDMPVDGPQALGPSAGAQTSQIWKGRDGGRVGHHLYMFLGDGHHAKVWHDSYIMPPLNATSSYVRCKLDH